jgi:lipopolysaccharide export system permease protein
LAFGFVVEARPSERDMKTFERYVLRLFLWNFAMAWLGFTALLQIFDLLNNVEEVIERHPRDFLSIGEYVLWRLPEIATFLVPFAVLIGALICLGRLERGREITALKAAGMPYYRVIAAFLPGVAIIAAGHFLLADQLAPRAINHLLSRNLYVEKKAKKSTEDERVWIQDGLTVVQAGRASNQGLNLADVWIYRRDRTGRIVEQIYADKAQFDVRSATWSLRQVAQTTLRPDAVDRIAIVDKVAWKTRLGPQEFSDLIERPQSMPLARLWGFAVSSQIGVRPTYFYETWLHKRLALPFASILMVLLAAPVANSLYRRDRTLATGLVAGFALGFVFFVFDGLVQAMGESGALPPVMAAWLPVLLFTSIGGLVLMRQEGI